MTVHEGYQVWAATYDSDRNLTRDLDHTVTQQVVGDLPATAILELGCGTGKNTVWLAQRGVPVLALDFSPAMLRHAQTKVTSDHVRFALADLTQPWDVADQSVDLIVGNLVLEHIEDLGFIFAQAARCLVAGGHYFMSELHPFKQYRGTKARFEHNQTTTEIPAFVHHTSEYVRAARDAGLTLLDLQEWWHPEDQQTPPRLLSLVFRK